MIPNGRFSLLPGFGIMTRLTASTKKTRQEVNISYLSQCRERGIIANDDPGREARHSSKIRISDKTSSAVWP